MRKLINRYRNEVLLSKELFKIFLKILKWFHAENKMKTIRNSRDRGFDKKKKRI